MNDPRSSVARSDPLLGRVCIGRHLSDGGNKEESSSPVKVLSATDVGECAPHRRRHHRRHHRKRRGTKKLKYNDGKTQSAAQAECARRRSPRRRESLRSVDSDSCLATQRFFSDRNVGDILNQPSDMEKPTWDRRSTIVDDDQLSLPELAGLISRQLDDAIERGLYTTLKHSNLTRKGSSASI